VAPTQRASLFRFLKDGEPQALRLPQQGRSAEFAAVRVLFLTFAREFAIVLAALIGAPRA
jgi:hypothetical protein